MEVSKIIVRDETRAIIKELFHPQPFLYVLESISCVVLSTPEPPEVMLEISHQLPAILAREG